MALVVWIAPITASTVVCLPRRSSKKVLRKCSEMEEDNDESGVIAFHCKAGFGRSIAMAATWMVYKYDIAGHLALAWTRIARPGSITTPQQASYLYSLSGRESVEQDMT